jgi:hypothetical protein
MIRTHQTCPRVPGQKSSSAMVWTHKNNLEPRTLAFDSEAMILMEIATDRVGNYDP